MDTIEILWVIGGIIALFAVLVVLAVFARYFRLWIQSVTTGAGISIFDLLGMTFRKVNPAVIVRSKIMAVQAGLDEATTASRAKAPGGPLPGRRQRAAGDPLADRRQQGQDDRPRPFKQATAIDLAGRNVLEAVQTSVYPKVIDCPARGSARPSLDAVAKNGIQLKVKARVTVRANLQQLDRRSHRRDDHRPRRRRHRQRHRLGRQPQSTCWRIPT